MHNVENVIASLYQGRAQDSVIFIEADGSRMTTEIAFQRLKRMARVLSDHGVQVGDRVSLRLNKSLNAVLLAHGAMWLGAIVHPLNTAYTDPEVLALLQDASPKVLVCDEGEGTRFLPIAKAVGAKLLVLPFAEEKLVDGPVSSAATTSKTPAALLYTSGTTGKPKGALISHENLLHSASSLATIWKLSRDDILLHPLPVFHAHGLLTSINTMLASGGAVHFLAGFEVHTTIAAMQMCSIIMAVPTQYARLLQEPSFGSDTVDRLRMAVSGSAPLPVSLAAEFRQRTGVQLIERYGSTEAAIITALPAGSSERTGWVGWPLPDVEVRVRKDDGQVYAYGIGGLETRGPNVFVGYWNNPAATTAAFVDDWFVTGDVAEIDCEGCVRLLGREKEIVITGGLNVYPAEVENALRGLGQVKDAAVFGVPHPDFGEAVIAAVELKDWSCKFDPKQMQADLRVQLAAYKIPKKIVVTEALPKNAMGKLLKGPLREANFRIFSRVQ